MTKRSEYCMSFVLSCLFLSMSWFCQFIFSAMNRIVKVICLLMSTSFSDYQNNKRQPLLSAYQLLVSRWGWVKGLSQIWILCHFWQRLFARNFEFSYFSAKKHFIFSTYNFKFSIIRLYAVNAEFVVRFAVCLRFRTEKIFIGLCGKVNKWKWITFLVHLRVCGLTNWQH